MPPPPPSSLSLSLSPSRRARAMLAPTLGGGAPLVYGLVIGSLLAAIAVLLGVPSAYAAGMRRALRGSARADAPCDASQFAMYYINLDVSVGRRRAIERSFAAQGLRVERLRATRGDDFLAAAAPDEPLLRHLAGHFRRRPDRVGHLGCLRSHLRAYERFLRTRRPYCLVFEDDCEFLVDDFWPRLLAAMGTLPDGWDLALPGYHVDEDFHPSHASDNAGCAPLRGWLPLRRFTGMHCYTLTRRAARALLDGLASPRWYLDWSVSDLLAGGALRAYGAVPPLATQPATPRIRLGALRVDTAAKNAFESTTNRPLPADADADAAADAEGRA